MMNIGQLMRSLLGVPEPGDSRTLELKAGQVVRGVVTKLLEGQDALVQINGNQIRAKLEIPLQPGQATLLQVQPQSEGATVVLKPVEGTKVQPTPDTLKELAKGLRLPEAKWAFELLSNMRRDGVPFTRETGQGLGQAFGVMPQGADPEVWMTAAATALKRGLPMTEGTISALQQVMFGKPVHELLDALQTQLKVFAAEGTVNAAKSAEGGARAAAVRAAALLGEGESLLRALQAPAAEGPALPAGAAEPLTRGGTAVQPIPQAPTSIPTPTAAPGSTQASTLPPTQTSTPAQTSAPAEVIRGSGTNAPAANAEADAKMAAAATTGSAGTANAATSNPAGAAGWISELLKWLGVEHERQLIRSAAPGMASAAGAAKAGEQASPAGRPAPGSDGQAHSGSRPGAAQTQPYGLPAASALERAPGQWLPAAGGASEAQAAEAARPGAAQESLKSVLLSLAASDDAAPPLREAAQQLVLHITGQQLLLTPEKGGIFTHVTMFIPFKGPDGEHTASVRIQSRRSGKGGLDAENCRLLFDLHMKRLGEVMVDVQVVDKIVSLNIWNDHPAIGPLLESSRQEITEALHKAGYQLLALRTATLPDAADSQTASLRQTVQPTDRSAYASKPYKGMDVRI